MTIKIYQYQIKGDDKPLAGLSLLLGFMATRKQVFQVDWCLEAFQMFNECPVIPNFHRKLYDLVLANEERFDMSRWGCESGNYECGSPMCRGGFTLDLCGKAPYGYAQQHDSFDHVVYACYVKNCPDLDWLPNLTASDNEALKCMRCAAFDEMPDDVRPHVSYVNRADYLHIEREYYHFCDHEYGDK